MEPKTRYAKSGGVHIAYRVFGDGPRDIVVVPGTVSHVELYWELPANHYLLKRLASFSRVIVFDKRGQGLSDRVAEQTLEERLGDVRAVMDAAGSKRATVYGWSEGGQMSLAFAATHPERTSSLVLYGAYASMKAEPWAVPREGFAQFLAAVEKHWGEGILVRINAPSRLKDESFVQWFGRLERAVASPGAIVALMRANYEIDVRHLLPSIRVPSLILHREGDALVPVQAGRYLAWHIPQAKYFELPGNDHLLQAFDQNVLDLLLDQIEEFITGVHPRPQPDRMLAGVIPADPVGPAQSAALAAARAECGPLTDAIAELERCRDVIASGDDRPELAGLIAQAEALAAAARGSWQESESQFIKAVESFRRHKMVWQEAQTLQTWERTLLAGIDRRALIEKLDSAIEIYRRQRAGESRIDSIAIDLAHTKRSNGGSGAQTGTVEAAASPDAVFQREGDYWTVAWQGNLVRLKDAKGFHYLAYLLANPGRHVLARELAMAGTAAGRRRASAATAANLGDAGALLDPKAREQYRLRIGELREELAEAVRLNDTGRAARLRSELECFGDQIAAAVGIGGRSRRACSHGERARLMVTKAIKAAIAKIRASNSALGRYFATSIKTGNFCAYDPGPDHPPHWEL